MIVDHHYNHQPQILHTHISQCPPIPLNNNNVISLSLSLRVKIIPKRWMSHLCFFSFLPFIQANNQKIK